MPDKKYGSLVAITTVIANMIGVGVFTSLSFQVLDIKSGFAIVVLWLVGGLVAFCGAFAYAEISGILKRSGGEYHYLSQIYHPALGFSSGWASLIVGFAAPVAVLVMALGEYFSPVIGGIDPKIIGTAALLVVAGIHLLGVHAGGLAQNVLTGIKLALIVVFCLAPFFMPSFVPSQVSFAPDAAAWGHIVSAPFFVSLVYVYLAYSGWNASVYIAGNLRNPRRALPYSLIMGTGIVAVLYISLNVMFLRVCNYEELAYMTPEGPVFTLDVGNAVALKLFGTDIGKIFAGLFSLALISSISGQMIAGPRVAEAMGEDYRIFRPLARKSSNGAPYVGILLQTVLALLMVWTSTFQTVLQYIGVCLSIFATLTVFGIYILRARQPNAERSFRAIGYPVTPALFILINLAMMVYVVKGNWLILLYTILTIGTGVLLYFVAGKRTDAVTVPPKQ